MTENKRARHYTVCDMEPMPLLVTKGPPTGKYAHQYVHVIEFSEVERFEAEVSELKEKEFRALASWHKAIQKIDLLQGKLDAAESKLHALESELADAKMDFEGRKLSEEHAVKKLNEYHVENQLLKKKLEKCQEQRNENIRADRYSSLSEREIAVAWYDKELSALTNSKGDG